MFEIYCVYQKNRIAAQNYSLMLNYLQIRHRAARMPVMKYFPLDHPSLLTAALAPQLTTPLLAWFEQHKRPLPWRQNYSPYAVWVSEIMLQQTQMERGVLYFLRWMQALPTIAAVAAADEEQILCLWEGLGYYSRARNLHKAAKHIMAEHGGIFPNTLSDIRALSGIGSYTAAAIASIAFEQDVPCIDANVERVLARVFDIDRIVKQEPAAGIIRTLSQTLLPHGKARAYNQAMMELGALVCGKKPRCAACPLAALCQSKHLGIADQRPVLPQKAPIRLVDAVTGVLFCDGAVFIQKRLENDVWGGLWEFPGGKIEQGESPEQAIVREFMEETGFAVRVKQKITVIRHNYTTYRITLHCFMLELAPAQAKPAQPSAGQGKQAGSSRPQPPVLTAASAWLWEQPCHLTRYGQPAAHRKLADMLFGQQGQGALPLLAPERQHS